MDTHGMFEPRGGHVFTRISLNGMSFNTPMLCLQTAVGINADDKEYSYVDLEICVMIELHVLPKLCNIAFCDVEQHSGRQAQYALGLLGETLDKCEFTLKNSMV
jgi:hypothetical protein